MTAITVLSLVWLGICCNLAFTGAMIQPDWGLSLLLGSLLAHRGNWPWVLAGAAAHDLTLHWSLWMALPVIAITPIALIYLDIRLGPGLPQRVLMLLLASIDMLRWGWSPSAWILTVCLATVAWHGLNRRYARAA